MFLLKIFASLIPRIFYQAQKYDAQQTLKADVRYTEMVYYKLKFTVAMKSDITRIIGTNRDKALKGTEKTQMKCYLKMYV